MTRIQCVTAIGILLFLCAGLAGGQPFRTTLSWTESGEWELPCVGEKLTGDIAFNGTFMNSNVELRLFLKQKAILFGQDSGDQYTLTRSEKISIRALDDGMNYVKHGVAHFTVHRNKKFLTHAHANLHITFNAKNECVVWVDHRIQCGR